MRVRKLFNDFFPFVPGTLFAGADSELEFGEKHLTLKKKQIYDHIFSHVIFIKTYFIECQYMCLYVENDLSTLIELIGVYFI